jgi:hypothetical protein
MPVVGWFQATMGRPFGGAGDAGTTSTAETTMGSSCSPVER